ncbi:hypothetical protein AB0L47_37910 [Streptomyces bobili]|uniref:hypothetical protein n=1 Tax=Streptomyces bobili TaxID=67280 RepID=UPI0034463B2C
MNRPTGATVAVTGEAGAVGGYAVQPAKAAGPTVIADAAAKDRDLVTGLGPSTCSPAGANSPNESVNCHPPARAGSSAPG